MFINYYSFAIAKKISPINIAMPPEAPFIIINRSLYHPRHGIPPILGRYKNRPTSIKMMPAKIFNRVFI